MSAVELSRPRRELVQVMARRGATLPALEGMALPAAGHAVIIGDLTALWIQPNSWMLMAPWAGDAVLLQRAAPLAPRAALIDQSHGRVTFGIHGPQARAVLAKGCRIDLHPRAFGPGRVAATSIAHVNALLHQTGADSFEVTVPSTLADHMQDWLRTASAEFR